jgi:hypothetical protein
MILVPGGPKAFLKALSRRKQLYLIQHPETENGNNQHTRGSCNLQNPPAPSFVDNTAAGS